MQRIPEDRTVNYSLELVKLFCEFCSSFDLIRNHCCYKNLNSLITYCYNNLKVEIPPPSDSWPLRIQSIICCFTKNLKLGEEILPIKKAVPILNIGVYILTWRINEVMSNDVLSVQRFTWAVGWGWETLSVGLYNVETLGWFWRVSHAHMSSMQYQSHLKVLRYKQAVKELTSNSFIYYFSFNTVKDFSADIKS